MKATVVDLKKSVESLERNHAREAREHESALIAMKGTYELKLCQKDAAMDVKRKEHKVSLEEQRKWSRNDRKAVIQVSMQHCFFHQTIRKMHRKNKNFDAAVWTAGPHRDHVERAKKQRHKKKRLAGP